jgi:hypothetical protein
MDTKEWMTHPVLLVGGAFVAGITLSVTVLIPVYTTSVQERLAKQTDQIEHIYDCERHITELKKQLSNSMIDLFAAERKTIFASGIPYPVGLSKVLLGDPEEKIKREYPDATYVDYQYTIENRHGLFDSVSFGVTDDHKVDRIIFGFSYNSKYRDISLRDIMTSVFGAPIILHRRDGDWYQWLIDGKYDSTITGSIIQLRFK